MSISCLTLKGHWDMIKPFYVFKAFDEKS